MNPKSATVSHRYGRGSTTLGGVILLAIALLAARSDYGSADESAPTRKRGKKTAAVSEEPADTAQGNTTSGNEQSSESPPLEPLAISPPGEGKSARQGLALGGGPPRRGGWGSLGTTFGSLALVLGLFGAVAWGMRRARPKSLQPLPADVFEPLGRSPLAGKLQAHLLRCGNKLLLVSISPNGAETLTEITDPVEVDRLTGLCRAQQPQSTTASFKQIWREFAKEKTTDSFVDSSTPTPSVPPEIISTRIQAVRGAAHLHPREVKRA